MLDKILELLFPICFGILIGIFLDTNLAVYTYLTATTTDQKVVILERFKKEENCQKELSKRLEFGPPEKAIFQCSKEQ